MTIRYLANGVGDTFRDRLVIEIGVDGERYDRGWEASSMPYYVFLCQDCNHEFTQFLHISDLDKDIVACPHCGSKLVVQAVAAFSAVTSKKS